MIQETCQQIARMREQWALEKGARHARRDRLRYIDGLINRFELLNLADEPVPPFELTAAVARLTREESHPIAERPPGEATILEWMDALYDLQDGLMIEVEDDIE